MMKIGEEKNRNVEDCGYLIKWTPRRVGAFGTYICIDHLDKFSWSWVTFMVWKSEDGPSYLLVTGYMDLHVIWLEIKVCVIILGLFLLFPCTGGALEGRQHMNSSSLIYSLNPPGFTDEKEVTHTLEQAHLYSTVSRNFRD